MTNDRQLECDVLVVGGGINGAGIARDCAGRGLSVILCDKDDLGAHTSSASSKLIHGGLRYLEHREFGLVRKALAERELLLRSAPHIMHPLRFVMPHDAGQRPAWLIRAGLFLYDRLAPRDFLPGSESADLACHPAGVPLKPAFTRGFVYSDGWVDDARLVVLNAMDARERGAMVLTHTRCTAFERHPGHWMATLAHAGGAQRVKARCLVNAAGPWAASVAQLATGTAPARRLRLVKGSHIVVPRLFDHPFAYIFQHPDGRIVFAMPYEGAFTLIGTTDVEFQGDPDQVGIAGSETSYLCELANRYFRHQLTPGDVVWSYSGVRPLLEDAAASAAAATRDYLLGQDSAAAPLLSVFGGKITTYRRLAQEGSDWICRALGRAAPAWTGNALLPGGDLFGPVPGSRGVLEFGRWVAALQQRHAWLPPALAQRWARAYGTRVEVLLGDAGSIAGLGEQVAPGLYAAELRYLVRHEWARCAQDVLWRRSKLGLHLPPGCAGDIDAWIAACRQGLGAAPLTETAW
ncbi:glycerol-3-phosphate dehydrogenase [Massilia yuzhufengensis]|uniref:Glycerol-3-phosphate dehydrogenase n=1 Tax=Massilia yuzhufengensis TaxID=1164594 RepID=A0A1I1QFV4_9BURK|nr:glycerol-3-phosphate dehydrogenase [Massilia yuzhufengensis]SFD20949.1 homodimeric glycerol 3-phosphate dehydrogenase (quinone) [Massilia yuzhufengensis]